MEAVAEHPETQAAAKPAAAPAAPPAPPPAAPAPESLAEPVTKDGQIAQLNEYKAALAGVIGIIREVADAKQAMFDKHKIIRTYIRSKIGNNTYNTYAEESEKRAPFFGRNSSQRSKMADLVSSFEEIDSESPLVGFLSERAGAKYYKDLIKRFEHAEAQVDTMIKGVSAPGLRTIEPHDITDILRRTAPKIEKVRRFFAREIAEDRYSQKAWGTVTRKAQDLFEEKKKRVARSQHWFGKYFTPRKQSAADRDDLRMLAGLVESGMLGDIKGVVNLTSGKLADTHIKSREVVDRIGTAIQTLQQSVETIKTAESAPATVPQPTPTVQAEVQQPEKGGLFASVRSLWNRAGEWVVGQRAEFAAARKFAREQNKARRKAIGEDFIASVRNQVRLALVGMAGIVAVPVGLLVAYNSSNHNPSAPDLEATLAAARADYAAREAAGRLPASATAAAPGAGASGRAMAGAPAAVTSETATGLARDVQNEIAKTAAGSAARPFKDRIRDAYVLLDRIHGMKPTNAETTNLMMQVNNLAQQVLYPKGTPKQRGEQAEAVLNQVRGNNQWLSAVLKGQTNTPQNG